MSVRDPTEAPGDPSAGSLTGDLAEARPPVDHAAMEDVRARAERALFGRAEPARLGRFVLLRPIAGGGMGMIHRAYDPQLERPVALKLLHPRQHDTDRARARLIAEARVLARLAHPNVVPVYDVVEIEGQVVIVMELVEGRTLAEWERERRRSWREIVAVYVQAGRGLAAAHDLGIVHRDFKPANAIVGDDGRVRVLDFGLARFTATPDEPGTAGSRAADEQPPGARGDAGEAPAAAAVVTAPPAPSQAPSGSPSSLTVSGEILGTVAYMAPEQLAGERSTPASDQFSFCVALHRALYGVAPFSGQDAATLRERIAAGRIAPASGARVPAWLRALVVRGLAAAPEGRHPSMKALLDQLGRERGWRRWRWAALAAVTSLIALGSGVVALGRDADPLAACDGGAEEIGRVWSPARGRQIRDALAGVDTPYARAVGDQVVAALDGYRDRWSAMHRAACREYRSVRLSDDRFDRRTRCLDRRLQDLASAVDVLGEIDRTSAANAVDVAARLPPVEPCAEIDALPEEDDPPATAEARDRVAAIRAQLSLAGALERAGRSADALALADRALVDAQRVAYPRAVLEAALAKGRILVLRYDFAEAVAPLAMAEQLALERRQLSDAVVAAARRIYAQGIRGMALDRLAGQVDQLELLSRGLRADHFARPLLLNYVGVLYMARGERDQAREHFEAARASLAGVEAPDLELAGIDMNLAMLTEDRAGREELGRAALTRFKEQLGPYHLRTLAEQCRYARYVADPKTALDLVRDAGALYRRFHPDLFRDRSQCASYEAFLTAELGDPDAAAARYAEAAALAMRTNDRDELRRGRLADGYAHLYRAAPDAALGHFAAVIEELARSSNWWEQLLVAEAHLGAGLAEEALGGGATRAGPLGPARPLERAAGHLERAAEIFAPLIGRNENLENRQRLALARMSLARVLRRRGAGAVDGRVRELEAQASAFYRAASPAAYRSRLDALPP